MHLASISLLSILLEIEFGIVLLVRWTIDCCETKTNAYCFERVQIFFEKKKKKKTILGALKSGCNKYVKMIILIALLFFFPTQMPINFLLVSEMKNSKEKEKKRQTAHKYTKKQWQTIDARMRMPMIYFGEINFFEAAKRCTQYEPYKYINICTSFRDCRVRLFVR